MENVTHNEDTLNKVYRTLVFKGHHTQSEAVEIVSEMQNAGILFRENGPDEVKGVVDMDLKNLNLEEAVYQSIGAASMCWESLDEAGVFQDDRARDIATQLLHRIAEETAFDVKEDVIAHAPAEPKEWIERQEEERRAWAIASAIDHLKTWGHGNLIDTARSIVEYVKDENGDLNDVVATDTFYLVMGEKLEEFDAVEHTEKEIGEFLIDCVDALAKDGVRLKDGSSIEEPA